MDGQTTIAPAQLFNIPNPERLTIDHVTSTHWLCHREWNSSKWKSLCARLFCLHVTIMMIGVFMSLFFFWFNRTHTRIAEYLWLQNIEVSNAFQNIHNVRYATDNNTSSYRHSVCFIELNSDYVERKKKWGLQSLHNKSTNWLIDSPLIDIYFYLGHDGFPLSVFNIILRWCL